MSETELKPFDKEVHEFRHWFYSADHRLKYNRDHPAYLAAWEAWKARANQPRPAVQAVFKELHDRIRAMCGRVEPIGGQLYSYVQKDEVLGWIEHYAAQQPEGGDDA